VSTSSIGRLEAGTRMGAPTDRRGYLHEAVLYDSDEEFLGVVVPFLQEGVAAGEPCLVALGASTTRLVRAAVQDTTGLTFLGDRYSRPASVIRSGVSEAISNALIHGRRPVRFRLWLAPDRIVATVTDRGDGPADPFAGLLPVSKTGPGGLGLWLTHQLCSHVTLDTTDHGFTIRLVVGTPQPGRSGHAADTA
jgi:hypothetical protein